MIAPATLNKRSTEADVAGSLKYFFGQMAQDRITLSANGNAQKAAGLSCLSGFIRYKLSLPLLTTNGDSDACCGFRKYAVWHIRPFCSALWTPQFVPKSLRSKSNLQKHQMESNLQSQAVKSNLLGAWIESQCAWNRDLNRIAIWFCPPLYFNNLFIPN